MCSRLHAGRFFMDYGYWMDRKRASKAMARDAASSEARLIHLHLAGCYSVKAASARAGIPLYAPGAGAEREMAPPSRGDET